MIPVELELHNFLAYRNPDPLDFEGIHVACLAGPNGAGKSSLLDAMTWALWGKSRAKRDDDLIHAGETEMMVALTFALDGNLYRARRARRKGGQRRSGTGTLELQVMDGELWRAISEGTMRDTQNKINRILRLDYDTFINSVFLLQGRADEFTTRTPAQRKEILAEILGLSVWESYEERARERLKASEEEAASLASELASIEAELQQEDAFEAQLIEAQREALALGESLNEAQEQMREYDAARNEIAALHQQAADLERRAVQAEGEIGALARQAEDTQARLDAFDEVLAEQADIEAGYAQLAEVRALEQELGDKQPEQDELRERRNSLEAAVGEARAELQTEQRVLEERQAELSRTIAQYDADGKLSETQTGVRDLEGMDAERAELAAQVTAHKEERAGLDSENKALKRQMDVTDDQLAQVRKSEATCPLCGQPLDESHRAELVAQFEREGGEYATDYQANAGRIADIDGEVARLEAGIASLQGELKRLPALQGYLARLEERNERAAAASAELEGVQSQLVLANDALARDDYAPEARAELDGVLAELAVLGYDAAAHREAREAVQTYQPFEARQAQLQQALAERPQAEATLAELEERRTAWEVSLAEDRERQAQLAASMGDLQDMLAQADAHALELRRIQDEEAGARMRVGAAQQRLDALAMQKERREKILAEQDRLAHEQSIYDELRVAFGKNGIPAMIIDAAIPELQETANHLLSRMTDGRMHVALLTQREKVTGGVAETLDIRISDGQNSRDYETFSGGEAMRINFALRIALSKLLARRAGAQLRTLVIDEGFGSQDEQGRERLMEAINSVQDDFDLILVITHLDELKEHFPVRIEISKTPDGSQIALV